MKTATSRQLMIESWANANEIILPREITARPPASAGRAPMACAGPFRTV
jgi:hypothetical protein